MGKISYVLHIFMLTTLLLDLGFGEALLYPLIFTPVKYTRNACIKCITV